MASTIAGEWEELFSRNQTIAKVWLRETREEPFQLGLIITRQTNLKVY